MGQVTTPTSDTPITYPDRIYNGKDFDTNINREQSSDNLTTVLTDKNEVLGFPDHTSTQEMQAAIEADRNGSISTYKPTFYEKFIAEPLRNLGMASFQPPFITDIKPTPERAFATSLARAATADVFKPEFSDQEAKANPIPAFAGSLVGSIAAFATGGALLDGMKLSQLTPFAENIIKGGALGGAYRGISETSNELRDQDHPDLIKIGQGVLHDALWWGGISGLAGAASKPVGVAASAGLGYLMAKSDGADEPSALLNGAVLGGFHLLQAHGDQQDVRQFVTDKLQSNIADYILAKSPMVHEEVAKQGGREYIANHAENAIEKINNGFSETGIEQAGPGKILMDSSNEMAKWHAEQEKLESEASSGAISISVLEGKLQEKEQELFGTPKDREDGYNPKTLNYLSQYIPVDRLVRMSGTDRSALAKQSVNTLETYRDQYEELQQILSGEKSKEQMVPDIDRMISEGGKVNVLEEAIKSKTILNQVMKNLTQEVMFKEGGENAGERGEIAQSGSRQEAPSGEAQAGVHLRDNGQAKEVGGEKVAPATERQVASDKSSVTVTNGDVKGQMGTDGEGQGERGTSKIAASINQKAVEDKLTKGFENLAGYEKINIKEQAQKATDLIKTDEEGARAIIRGEKPLPDGLRGTSLITAMEERLKANPDADIAYELANSPLVTETSKAAQELRLAAERTPDSASAKLAEIKKAKVEQAGGDKNLEKAKKSGILKGKAETEKINLSKEELSWQKYLDSIKC